MINDGANDGQDSIPVPSYEDVNRVLNHSRMQQPQDNDPTIRLRRIAQQTTATQQGTSNNLGNVGRSNRMEVLACNIASIASDEMETTNNEIKKARGDIKNCLIKNFNLKNELNKILDAKNNVSDIEQKMQNLQSEYARYVAWRLRHGLRFEFWSASTWLPYWGEVRENGLTNKVFSFFYNLRTPKSYFINPIPLVPEQHARAQKAVEQAIEEVSNRIV